MDFSFMNRAIQGGLSSSESTPPCSMPHPHQLPQFGGLIPRDCQKREVGEPLGEELKCRHEGGAWPTR